MPDITDQDRLVAHEWAVSIDPEMDCWSASARAVARVILATVDAPTTLSEELANITEHWEEWATDMITVALAAATDRAKQMEHDLAEASAEVERLTRDRGRLQAQVQGLTRRDSDHNSEVRIITDERDEANRDVERLTAVSERLRRIDNYRQFREQFLTVQKAAESNAETLDPADVKPGEAWIVECRGERRTAVKDHDDAVPWCTFNADGWFLAEDNEEVTLVTRIVPAPRVITNPDELDRLPHNSVILSADNDAWQKSSETSLWASAWWATSDGEPSMWASDRLCDEDHPVTVLWEPGA